MNESQINKLSARISSAFNLALSEASALAFKIEMQGAGERVRSHSSVLWNWRKDDAKRLAGHFYWLAKTYERAGETGRAITFKRASNVIYEAIDADQGFNFKAFIAHPHVGLKVRLEAYDYWLANGAHTARQVKLVNAGHVDPNYPPQSPKWEG
jgi:hypothetical protein